RPLGKGPTMNRAVAAQAPESCRRPPPACRADSTIRRLKGKNSMRKALLGSVLASGLFLSAAPAYAQFGGGCTQEDLEKATAAYIEAQTKGDPTPMPLGTWVTYNEQMDLG